MGTPMGGTRVKRVELVLLAYSLTGPKIQYLLIDVSFTQYKYATRMSSDKEGCVEVSPYVLRPMCCGSLHQSRRNRRSQRPLSGLLSADCEL